LKLPQLVRSGLPILASARLTAAMCSLAIISCLAPVALAQKSDIRIDVKSGRSLAQYPPAVSFDHQHMKLAMDIPDVEVAAFSGVMTLTSRAVGNPQRVMDLDARSTITIQQITIDGQPATFTHSDDLLTIDLGKEIAAGAQVTLQITYKAEKPGSEGSGLNWFRTRPGREAQGAMIYSQGQSNFNSFWFPCHDFPNDRLSVELLVTVDSAYAVISNGALLSKQDAAPGAAGKPRSTWHWKQQHPHPAYLTMVAIGLFDVADVGGDQTARPGLPMRVYGPPGTANDLKTIFEATPRMVAYFEKLFDEPYPWEKYDQIIVRNFRWGGMENTSATILAEYAASKTDDNTDLIVHELVHQWFGNLVTCRSWEHLWLNEGMATFGEWLWIEHDKGREAYLNMARTARRNLLVRPLDPAPRSPAMISKYYGQPDDTFTKSEDPYGRGGLLLHMLRMRIGDAAFFKGLATYLDQWKFNQAETDDFRRVMEDVSGHSLERFFEQWGKRPGVPKLRLRHTYDAKTKQLNIKLEQTQVIDGDNPAYAMSVPIWCKKPDGAAGDGGGAWISIDIDAREATASFPLDFEPASLTIDPEVRLLWAEP
jgi:aminopeptidase N